MPSPASPAAPQALPQPVNSLKDHARRTLALAAPVMLARAGVLAMVAADTVMVGQVAAHELGHYGLGAVPFLVFMLFGVGALMGSIPLIAQADGAGRHVECGRIWRFGLIAALVFGLVGTTLLVFAESALIIAGQSPELARGAARVSWMFALGLPFLLMHTATGLFLEGIGRPMAGMLVMGGGNLANIALNYLLLFEPFGLPAMGAEGAAMATTSVRALMFVALAAYALGFDKADAYGVRAPLKGHAGLGLKLLRLGLPFGIANGVETTAFQSVMIFAGWLGAAQIAAYQAVNNVIAIIFMLSLGIATATSVRVGNAVGRGDATGRRMATVTGLALSLAVTLLLSPFILFGREVVAAVYIEDPAIRALAVSPLVLLPLVLVFDGTQVVLLGALRGASDIWPPTWLHLGSCWLVLAPGAYLLAHPAGFGLPGLVLGTATGLLAATVILGVRLATILRRPIVRV